MATPSPTQVKILVPGNHLMVGLLGQRDELLRLVEAAFPVEIHVRGNEITDHRRRRRRRARRPPVRGDGRRCSSRATSLDREGVGRTIEMLKADQRPTEVLTTEVLRGPQDRCGRRPRARSATSTRCATTRSRSASVRPARARATSRSRWRCRRCRRRQINRIILTRPAVEAGERLGFLPGDILAKVDPYLRPLYDALYDMLEPEVVARLMERGTIEVAPLAFMRGRTLNDSFIILDEAQNTTPEQMKMFLTRLGFGSKVVVTGDVTQIDLPEGRGRSGLLAVRDILDGIDGLAFVRARLGRRRAPPDRAGHRRRLRAARTTEPPMSDRVRRRRAVGRSRSTSLRWVRLAAAGARPRSGCPSRRRDVADLRRREAIADLNERFLGGSGPTDVLAFPMDDDVAARRPPARPGRARARARRPSPPIRRSCSATSWCARRSRSRQATEHGGTLDDELALLVVHGVLHLLDYDHAEDRGGRGDAAARARAARRGSGELEQDEGGDRAVRRRARR